MLETSGPRASFCREKVVFPCLRPLLLGSGAVDGLLIEAPETVFFENSRNS
jgi:hypothetical protein